ncbi:hypothetical protein A11A3_03864 [Alcanivorax hongdengensis A-11-3]|uniref:Lipoprotein n=1 Tax=Alcanivorax hongdengensis A-11-3 TaxID=1177179 RepID=L0WF55_9GAMM|nr:lipoprotein [Alcanivorax hongdengensis]EKF75463.1 hypothetical protein A11A3_03864 [Alcanivorax hongdengensis A-11-3]
MRALIPLLLLGLLSACGQKGSLYFAPQPAKQAAPAADTTPDTNSSEKNEQDKNQEQPDAQAAEQD